MTRCTTHHLACNCREEKIAELLQAAKILAQAYGELGDAGWIMAMDSEDDAECQHYIDLAEAAAKDVQRLYRELKF